MLQSHIKNQILKVAEHVQPTLEFRNCKDPSEELLSGLYVPHLPTDPTLFSNLRISLIGMEELANHRKYTDEKPSSQLLKKLFIKPDLVSLVWPTQIQVTVPSGKEENLSHFSTAPPLALIANDEHAAGMWPRGST